MSKNHDRLYLMSTRFVTTVKHRHKTAASTTVDKLTHQSPHLVTKTTTSDVTGDERGSVTNSASQSIKTVVKTKSPTKSTSSKQVVVKAQCSHTVN